jgi:hypothetical protein
MHFNSQLHSKDSMNLEMHKIKLKLKVLDYGKINKKLNKLYKAVVLKNHSKVV